jgi:hypothetical protein
MKLFIAVSLLLASSWTVRAQDLKVYAVKSGIIEYLHEGVQAGKSTMSFDNYGNLCATWTDLTVGGERQKGWVITKGDVQYLFDPAAKTGMKITNPLVEGLRKTKDIEKYAEQLYATMGMKPAGTEKCLGKECKRYAGSGGKVLTWNGLLMLMDITVMGQTTRQRATKIDVNVPVKASLFEIPSTIRFDEIPVTPPTEEDEEEEEPEPGR